MSAEIIILGGAAVIGGYALLNKEVVDKGPALVAGPCGGYSNKVTDQYEIYISADGLEVAKHRKTGKVYRADMLKVLRDDGLAKSNCQLIEKTKWHKLADLAEDDLASEVKKIGAKAACEAMNATALANPAYFPGFKPKDCSKVGAEDISEIVEYVKLGFVVAAGAAGYIGGAMACSSVGLGAIAAKFCGALGAIVATYIAGYIWDGAEWVVDKIKFW